jgi:ribose 5-phosphate isomerase RpiB
MNNPRIIRFCACITQSVGYYVLMMNTKQISKLLKIVTREITSDPHQYAAFVDADGIGLLYAGNQHQTRNEVRKLAAAKLDKMGDNPAVMALVRRVEMAQVMENVRKSNASDARRFRKADREFYGK